MREGEVLRTHSCWCSVCFSIAMLGPTCAKRSRYLNSVNKVKGCERAASNPGFYGRTQVVTAGGGMRAAQMIAHANVAIVQLLKSNQASGCWWEHFGMKMSSGSARLWP